MAALKADGMLFRGDLQGEPKPAGRLRCSIVFLSGAPIGTADEAEFRPPLGAASFSIAVSESPQGAKRDERAERDSVQADTGVHHESTAITPPSVRLLGDRDREQRP
jgi:hypothetical protein